MECWSNFFNDILAAIINNTNKHIESMRGNYQRQRCKANSKSEVKATTGLHIITYLPCVTGSDKLAKSPMECWNSFFNDDIVAAVVDKMNKYIERVKGNYLRQRDAKPTPKSEVKAIIGPLKIWP